MQIEQITYDSLTLRYPPSVAQFLMEEIEKVEMARAHANQDVAHDLMRDDRVQKNPYIALQKI